MSEISASPRYEPIQFICDFDGVLNVLHPSPVLGFVQAELDCYALQGNPVVIAGLDHVIRNYNLRPTWASMWSSLTPEAGRLLGIGGEWPALPINYPDEDGLSSAHLVDGLDGVAELKHPFIKAIVGREPLLWADDDITPRLERWGARRNRTVPTLLIRPNSKIGLTMWHLEEMIRFIERVRVWREERGPSSTQPRAA